VRGRCRCIRQKKDGAGDFHLTAYLLVPRRADGFAADVKYALAAKLPSYMIPAEFVLLDAFPLGLTGKADRRALVESPAGNQPPEHSMTEQEPIVYLIWEKVLGYAPVSLETSFFCSAAILSTLPKAP